jgi:rhodanese-related sulfurtransferase
MSASAFNQPIAQVWVTELASRMAEPDSRLQLVDVREPEELAIAQVDGFLNLPLSEYEEWSTDIRSRLDPDVETIVMCHHGMRSAQMCQWLISQGFTNVKNLVGGIDAYSQSIDPSVPQY